MNTFAQPVSEAASSAALKVSPALTVTAISLVAYLPTLVYVLTAAYTAFQFYFLLRDKWWRQRGQK